MRIFQALIIIIMALFGHSFFTDDDFEQWKSAFRGDALRAGISAEIVDMAFRGVLPDTRVLQLARNQPEFTRPVWVYLDKAVSQERIQRGRELLVEHQSLLQQISRQYPVPEEYLLAIWGMESSFGSFKGHYAVIRSLATLSYQGREQRRPFWRKQLLAALKLLEQGDIPLAQLHGSWAGAFGHTQFIPTSFLQYAVDFDGDGKRDIVNSVADALASSANLLVQSGWKNHKPWGGEALLPEGFVWEQSNPGHWQSINQWVQQTQLRVVEQSRFSGDEHAFILLPAGHRGPAFLALDSFEALLDYNRSDSYALAVGLLGDAIQQRPALVKHWPRAEPVLSRAEKAELQTLLSTVGYNTQGIDGLIGPKTQSALQSWQSDVGFPADGFATLEHLHRLRKQVLILEGKSWEIEKL